MKKKILLPLAILFAVKYTIAQDYNRSSLSIFFVQYADDQPFSSDLIKNIDFPNKFDKNDIGQDVIYLDKNFKSAGEYSASQEVIDKIYSERIPNKILRSILIDENKGYMTVEKLQKRGQYNAKDADVIIAKNSERQLAAIQDQGQYSLNRIYFLIIQPTNIDIQSDQGISQGKAYTLNYKSILYQIDVTDQFILSNEFWFSQPSDEKMNKLMTYHFPIKEVSNKSLSVVKTNMDGLAKASRLTNLIKGSISVNLSGGNSTTNTGNFKPIQTKPSSGDGSSNPNARTTNSRISRPSNSSAYADSMKAASARQRSNAMRQQNKDDNLKAGAAALAVVGIASLLNDEYSDKFAYMKFHIGLGWDEIPLILNTEKTNKSSTDVTSHPNAHIGLKLGLFNNKPISMHLSPFYTYGFNALTPGASGSHTSYGGTGTLLLGLKAKSKIKLFGEYGYISRSGDYTFDKDAADPSSASTTGEVSIGSYDYSSTRIGGGIMFHFINEENKESYIKPGVFYERPSFIPDSKESILVGNIQIMISSFILIDFTYSKSYPIAGTAQYAYSPNEDKDFFSIKLIKAGRIF